MFQFGGLGALFGGLSPLKHLPRGDGTVSTKAGDQTDSNYGT